MGSENNSVGVYAWDEQQQQLTNRNRRFDNRVRLALPDNSLAPLGYVIGARVEVLLGDIWQGDLAAVLLSSGIWLAGFAFFAYGGVRLHGGRTDLPPRFVPLDGIAGGGRVVRLEKWPVVQAGVTLPAEGVDRIRFRFRL